METGLNKTYQSIALYFGVFSVAYAGFFYQTYAARQEGFESSPLLEKSFPAAENSASGNTHKSNIHSTAENFSGAETRIEELERTGTAGSGKKRKPKQKQQDRNEREQDTGTYHTSGRAYAHRYPNDSLPDSRATVNGLSAAGYSAPVYSVTAPAMSISSSVSSTSSDTGFAEDIASTGDSENTSVVAPGDNQDVNSETLNDNASPTADNDNTTSPVEVEEERWATPDCPYRLPEGSTEEEAIGMQTTYGCRYRNACVNLNDGTGSYFCRWEYIRSS